MRDPRSNTGVGGGLMPDQCSLHIPRVVMTRASLLTVASVMALVGCGSSGAKVAATTSATSTTPAQSGAAVTVPDSKPLHGDSWTLATGHTASGASCLALTVGSVSAPQVCLEKTLLAALVIADASDAQEGKDGIIAPGFLAPDTQISSLVLESGAKVAVVQEPGFYVAIVPKGGLLSRLVIRQSGNERTCTLMSDNPKSPGILCGA